MATWQFAVILVKIVLIVGTFQGAVAYLILVERKIAAWAQDRVGPNRAGPFGLIQPLADGAKMLLKEDVIPGYVNKPLYVLAPAIAIIAATIGFAVVPFGPAGLDAPTINGEPIAFQIAPNVDIGILYVFAIGSLAVYGVILAGWASNNKYSFLGGLRSSAQIISYEIPLGLSVLGMLMLARSLELSDIIAWQDAHGLGPIPAWGVLVQPLGFLIFLVSSFAETNRLPFDLPESEQELVGGFHTEYSAMKFGMFFLGEYLHIITVSFLTVILFFGGWDVPFAGLGVEDTGWIAALIKVAVMTSRSSDGHLRHVDPLDPAAVPLRPADEPGLEGDDPAGAAEPRRDDDPDPALPRLRLIATARARRRSRLAARKHARRLLVNADDPNLKRLEPPKLTLLEKTYLPQILGGLAVTGRHIVGAAVGGKAVTVQYPEEQHVPTANYRGVHRLNKDEQGRVKCVACMLCATACPAHCIDIVGATAPSRLGRPREVPRELRHRRACAASTAACARRPARSTPSS